MKTYYQFIRAHLTVWVFAVILCLFTQNHALSISDTKIATSRNSVRSSLCDYYTQTFTAQQRAKSMEEVQQYNYLSDSIVESLLFTNTYDYSQPLTLIITLPHLFCLVGLLFMIPFLLCCCAWPEKYPICRIWRKPDNQMYSKIELKWPAYISLVLYLIVCVGGLIALIEAPLIIKKFSDVGCKKAAMFDDMLNGRISPTVDGRFFVGLEPLRNELNIFNGTKIATFFSDSTNALSSATQVRTKQKLIQTTIDTTYTSYINSVYSTAFLGPSGTAYYDVNSAFKTMYLGPPTDSTKITGIIKSKLTTIFNQVNSALDDMIAAWNTLNFATQTNVKAQLTSLVSAVQTLKTRLQSYLDQVGAEFYKPDFYDSIYNLLSAYYGLVFGFAMLGFVGSILIAFCTVIRARLIVYFTCGFLVFLGIAGFCFLTYLMFIYPQMNQICSYVDKRLPSGLQTRIMLQKMGYQYFSEKVYTCMDDGDGKMIKTLNESFSQNFDAINILAQGTLKFNQKVTSFTQANIDAPFKQVAPILTQVKNAQVWDIDDNQAKSHVNKTYMRNYTLGVTCNSIAINGDAWMPSFSIFSCPAGKSKMTPCANLGIQTTCPLGCYQILNQFTSPSGDHSYISTLAQRYDLSGGTNCNYYQYIVNLHQRWNVPRQNKMDSVNGSISSLKVIVDDWGTKTNSVKAGLNSFKTTLQSNFNSMTNLTSGSFNGVDCRVVGESIWDFRDSFCIGLVQSVRYNIICLGLICYGVLLLACFATCTSVRHFKHLQKMQMHVGYKGTPISLSDTRILDK